MIGVRYAQCWEDADVLLEGLDVRPGDTCVSIASAGDNTLSLLCRNPAHVIAVDYRPEQIACLELRVSAYRHLEHGELLELIGSRPSSRRRDLYRRCRSDLSAATRDFWDSHPRAIAEGIGHAGKFERYLRLFRSYVLPLIHSRCTIDALLRPRAEEERLGFYHRSWNNRRWRTLFRLFFSRYLMARLGRDPACFAHAQASVAAQLLRRAQAALTTLDPASNPYLQWICTGQHGRALPFALRPENFALIRANLSRLEWRCAPLAQVLEELDAGSVDRFNLSDIFEYLAPQACNELMRALLRAARPGGRMLYWNLFAARSRPAALAADIEPLAALAQRLHERDHGFFYANLVIEQFTPNSATRQQRSDAAYRRCGVNNL